MTKTRQRNSTIAKKRYARRWLINKCEQLGFTKRTNIQMLNFMWELGLTSKPNSRNASNMVLELYEMR